MRTIAARYYAVPLVGLAVSMIPLSSPGSAATKDVPAHALRKDFIGPSDINPKVPPDIEGNPNDLYDAATYAWREFLYANWPATVSANNVVTRDTPDAQGAFFGTQKQKPLVWETFRQKTEIFPGSNRADKPPHGFPPPHSFPQTDGYNDPPQYTYNDEVPACPVLSGETQPEGTPWVNLDETSEIGLANMFAGSSDGMVASLANSRPAQIRYVVKANQQEYDYVTEKKI